MSADPINESRIAWLPDLLYTGGRFARGLALVCDAAGRIVKIAAAGELREVEIEGWREPD